MYYLELVKKTYQEAIALNPNINSGLKTALKSQERMPLFLKNLAIELEKVQENRNRKGKVHYSEKAIKDAIYDMVDVFIMGVEMENKARMESQLQKRLAEQEAQKKKDLEDTASGKVSGEYEELFDEGGITTDDDRSVL